MWYNQKRFPFSQKGIAERYQWARKMLAWRELGVSDRQLLALVTREISPAVAIGSEAFLFFWRIYFENRDYQKALKLLLSIANLPDDLSGTLPENQELVSRFAEDLAPDNPFWSELAQAVNDIFPKNELSQREDLAKKVHQLRYVISSQQAQYIRANYKKSGMTDREALAHFLKNNKKWWEFWKPSRTYTLKESARLHNKVLLDGSSVAYPDGHFSVNIKILLSFHTEFILDNQGNFLNEVDAEKVTENGIINGASFNYASHNDIRHHQLDVKPVGPHDPKFRKLQVKGYRSPTNDRGKRHLLRRVASDPLSYFNKKGLYAQGKYSRKQAVDRELKAFKKLL